MTGHDTCPVMLIWQSAEGIIPGQLELHNLELVSSPRSLNFLSESEKVRGSQISDPAVADTFIKCRWILKNKLAEVLNKNFDELEVKNSSEGKPYLINSAFGLDFNISHKNNHCLIGWTFDGKIGVDLEFNFKKDFKPNLAKKVFVLSELNDLQESVDPAKQFLISWSLKEALVKLNAGSLIKDSKSIELSIKDSKLIKLPESYISINQTSVGTFTPLDDFIISAAFGNKKKTPC